MSDMDKTNKKNDTQGFQQVDLNTLAEKKNLRMKIETIEEEDPEDAKLRRFKDRCLFVATLIAIAIVFGICICFLALRQDSPYTGIALNGVIGLTMALAGYYVRGKAH